MKKIIIFGLGLALLPIIMSIKVNAQAWQNVGRSVSGPYAYYTDIALDASGTPYVAYYDGANGYRATVKKFDGINWVPVGIEGFSAGAATFERIAFDNTGTPYVAFSDWTHDKKTTVMKYDGTNWVAVGSIGFSAGQADHLYLAIDRNGTPYVAYSDRQNGGNITMNKFDGTDWITVGGANFSYGRVYQIYIAFDANNIPFVSFRDDGVPGYGSYYPPIRVMNFAGGNWNTVGPFPISTNWGFQQYPAIAFNSSNTLYVAYQDDSGIGGGKATVKKLGNNGWVTVGEPSFSNYWADELTIAFDNHDTPYVCYNDDNLNDPANRRRGIVKKFDGANWVTVGADSISIGSANNPKIVINNIGIPYVCFNDNGDGNKAIVRTFEMCINPSITNQSTAGHTQCEGGSFSPITVSATGSNLIYQWYSKADSSNSGGTSLGNANGAQSNSYTPQADTAGKLYYYCVITNGCGISDTSEFSGGFVVKSFGVSTNTVTEIAELTAACGGNVISECELAVTSRGVCWSTAHNPTIVDNHTTDGSGTGSFTSNLTGLTSGTTYYVKAYATNSIGTAYGDAVSFITLPPAPTFAVYDYDGNGYDTVRIGTQTWLKQNLNVTHYRNGDAIPNVTDNAEWSNLTSGAYCDYNNDPNIAATYGKLYNWYSVDDNRNICPNGWHVASLGEWSTLTDYVGGENTAGSKLKEIGNAHWEIGTTATNETGFTALGAGYRTSDAIFVYIKQGTAWWSSTVYDSSAAWYQSAVYFNTSSGSWHLNQHNGYSVRCIKDVLATVSTDAASGVLETTAMSGGNVVDDGGLAITAQGVCWSIAHNPTIINYHTTDSIGVGHFTSIISGLLPNTTYYLRAYATNSLGTAYGDEVSFTTARVKLNAYEYWFNNDYANKVTQTVTPQDSLTVIRSISLAPLQNGLHVFRFRSRDNTGGWSSTISQFFFKNASTNGVAAKQINAYEYWFDNDYTNKIHQDITAEDSVSIISSINIASLQTGLHVFRFRSRDNAGVWSSTISQFFFKNASTNGVANKQIDAYEYWFNNDYSNKVTQTVTPQDSLTLATSISLASLQNGLQVFRFRSRDNSGVWSSTISQFFFKSDLPKNINNKIVAYRYWFDEVSNLEVNLTIPLTSADSVELFTPLDISNITKGWHLIHFQFQDSIGQWSSATSDSVEITKTLRVKLLLEGLFAGGGLMNQAKGVSVAQFANGIADTVGVELHNATEPYDIAFRACNANLHTDGTVGINKLPDSISGSYYISISHRNSIETWSSDAVEFNGANNIKYDFSDLASKAYGNNQKLMPGNVYAFFSGDANQDEIVDGGDMAAIDNSSTGVQVGYYPEDLNGDGIVDASDMAIIDNNSTAVVHVIRP